MHLPMKPIRLFSAFTSRAASIDDDHSAPGRIQGIEPIHHLLTIRSLNNYTRSGSHRSLACESGVISDDCTVLSNATTVKAGTPPKQSRKKQLRTTDASDSIITTTRTGTTTASVITALKGYKKDHMAASSPRSVCSDDCSPKSRHRTLFFWSSIRNEKLSQAALELAQQEHDVARIAQERRRNRHEMLSLPMKRFIVESAEMDICTTIAEF